MNTNKTEIKFSTKKSEAKARTSFIPIVASTSKAASFRSSAFSKKPLRRVN